MATETVTPAPAAAFVPPRPAGLEGAPPQTEPQETPPPKPAEPPPENPDQDKPKPAESPQEPPPGELEHSDQTDSLGQPFDSAKYRLKDGKPYRDKLGRFVSIRRGRKRKPKESPAPGASSPGANGATHAASFVQDQAAAAGPGESELPPPTDEPDTDPVTIPATAFEAMAEAHLRAFYGIAVGLISDEWLPEKAEHQANRDALAAYYKAEGKLPDSPKLALAAVALAYCGKRLPQPKTQTKLAALKVWIRAKAAQLLAWWRGLRNSRKIENATG